MELITKLEQFGLNQKQAAVYLACLELGDSSVQKIAEKTGIKRTSIYDILAGLITQGLIVKTIKGKKPFYTAEDPIAIKNIIVKKSQEFDQLLPELKSLYFIPGIKPVIRYYEGVLGIKRVLEDTLQSKEKILKAILPIKDILGMTGEDYFEQYTQKRIKLGYSLHVIRPETKEMPEIVDKYHWINNEKEKRIVRYAPKNFGFSMTMYLYDNKVTLISSKKEGFGLIIESEEFAYNQKTLFSVLWDVGVVS